MYFTDEKDYIMRMIKEMVRVLFSLMFGKKYVSVELEKENKYEVSGKNLKDFLDMIDSGEINEAENILLDSIDYTDRNEVMAAALFYQYLSEKDSEFLKNNNYTKEEVMSGFKQGRNYTPPRGWCIAFSEGSSPEGCDFPQSWSAPNQTGDATLPLRWLPPATLLWTCHLGTPCAASCSHLTSFIKYAIFSIGDEV